MKSNTDIYCNLIITLKSIIEKPNIKIIVIEGRPGTGKTTLARFLCGHLNKPLLELDNYIKDCDLNYSTEEINRIIDRKIDGKGKILIEGIKAISTLDSINKKADYLIYLENPEKPQGAGLKSQLDKYEETFDPRGNSNYILNTSSIFNKT